MTFPDPPPDSLAPTPPLNEPPPSDPSAVAPASPDGLARAQAIAEVVLCSGYPTQIGIAGLLHAGGMAPTTADGTLSATFVFSLSLLDTVALVGLILWLMARRGERMRTVFFGSRPLAGEAGFGVASLPIVIGLVIAVSVAIRAFAPWLHNVPDNPLEGLLGSQTGLLAFLFVVIVAGGFREELQRAFLLHRFRTNLGGAGVGLLITSVGFGLGHTLQGWDAAVITACLGALWGAMYLRRGGAAASIVSHSLFNSGELLRAFFA